MAASITSTTDAAHAVKKYLECGRISLETGTGLPPLNGSLFKSVDSF